MVVVEGEEPIEEDPTVDDLGDGGVDESDSMGDGRGRGRGRGRVRVEGLRMMDRVELVELVMVRDEVSMGLTDDGTPRE